MTINQILELPDDDLEALVRDEAKLATALAPMFPYTRPVAPAGTGELLMGKIHAALTPSMLEKLQAKQAEQAKARAAIPILKMTPKANNITKK